MQKGEGKNPEKLHETIKKTCPARISSSENVTSRFIQRFLQQEMRV